MLANDRTRRVAQTKFTKHEVLINKGNALALDGWWAAGEECRSLGVSVSEYARLASRESARKNTGSKKPYSENTIRQMVGYVLRALEQGDTRKTYDGLDHLRATMTETSTKQGKTKPALTAKQEMTKYLAGKSPAQLEFIIAEAKRQLSKKG